MLDQHRSLLHSKFYPHAPRLSVATLPHQSNISLQKTETITEDNWTQSRDGQDEGIPAPTDKPRHGTDTSGSGNIVDESKDCRSQNLRKSAVKQYLPEMVHKPDQRNGNTNKHVNVEGVKMCSLSYLGK